ncbi:translocation/assembly module TamB domain-containing protein [Paracoccus zhejiangensis]|uniref:DUF490 domain-containing protein n=1 Tax=Paracoccus zhejiangensis TaxID=1077935 RepID=A0A2H5F0Q1_9RHOB|nr:translocation/assembly module TamB domain-containing protein [Paracoccus zhejiangensis]AUH65124.1 DUF490 domain-containing protein [Paracoccus zhejiangensis]
MRKILLLLALILLPLSQAWAQDSAAEISEKVEDDKGFITNLLEENLSGAGREVIIDGFRGALSSRATYDQITIADAEGVWLTLKNGAIHWNRAALLRGRIEIAELSAAEILLPRLPSPGEQQRTAEAVEFSLPQLPVSINIEQILAERVELGEPVIGLPASVKVSGTMQLAGGEGTAKLSIDRLDGPRGQFLLDAGFANETRVLKLDLKLDEDADGLLVNLVDLHDKPSVKAEISGEGPLSDFLANITLATDGQPRVTGKASATAQAAEDGAPGTAFRLELGGDVASLLPPDNRGFFGTNTQLLADGWRGEDGRLQLPVLMIDTNALNVSGSLTTNENGAPEQAVLLMTLGADAGATELPVTLPFGGDLKVNDGRLELQYDAAQGDGWSLVGRVGEVDQQGVRIGALELNGAGTVLRDNDRLSEIDGKIEFGGREMRFDDAGLAQAIGDQITGVTEFSFVPGDVLELTNLSARGTDYGLEGSVLVEGLSTGIAASGNVTASYDDLSRLSQLAGRPVTGKAEAVIAGNYVVLTKGFDVNAQITGTDISVDQDQLDQLLQGESNITLIARRDQTGIQLNELTVNAQRLTAEAEGYLNSGSSDLKAKISMPSLSDADAELGGSLMADAFLSGASGSRRLTISGEAMDLKTGIEELDGALGGQTNLTVIAGEQDGGYVIEQFQFSNPQIKAEGQGNLVPGQMDAKADLDVPDLSVLGRGWAGSLTADATVREEGGVRFLDLTGRGTDLQLGQANVDGALTGETTLTAKVEQQGEVFTIRDLQLQNDQLNATAEGSYGPGQTDLTADLSIASLAALGQGWSGALQAQGRLQEQGDGVRRLNVTGTGTDLSLGQASVDGALTGQTRLSVRGTEQAGVFTIDEAHILNEQAEITAQGVVGGAETNVSGHVNFKQLAALGAGLQGSLVADGRAVAGSDGVIRVEVTGTGQDLAMGQQDLDAALSGPTAISLRGALDKGVFSIEDARIDNARLDVTASGKVGAGATDLTASLAAGDLRFLGRGISGAVNIDGRVVDQGGNRQITANGTINGLAIGQARIDPLLAGRTTLDLAATQSANGNLSIQRLVARNPQLSVNADGALQSGVNLDVTLNNLALLQPGIAGPARVSGTVRQPQAGGNYAVDLAATAPGGTRAQVSGTAAADFSTTDLRVSGVSDAALANPLIRTRSIEGPISFDIAMRGPPGLDAISGNVSLNGGRVSEPKLGLTLEALNVSANLQNGRIDVEGSGNVEAGGSLRVSGPVDLRNGTVDIGIVLDNVVLRDPNLYETRVSGNLSFAGVQADGPLISGRIDISEAELRIPSTGLGGAKAIPDIEHVGDSRPVAATRAKAGIEAFPSLASQDAGMQGPAATPPANPPRLDILLSAPNRVFIRGRGVDAEMGGQIRLTGTSRNVIPIGTLELIRGRVDLLGKRFVLTEGLVEMQGSLIPVIRLVAETSQDGITTRIIIDGEARDPEITFESSPEMPEEEVLSQLLFRRGLDKISPLQAAQLANAVAVLAGRGGEGIIGNLRNTVGLDDLDLQTDDEGNVEVRAGKYLSDNLYTDVSVGDDGKTELNLNLDISETLRARGSMGSDGESTLGVYFERDY